MDANIIPMGSQDIGQGIKSILMTKRFGKELFVIFKDPDELRPRFKEGWRIAKKQKNFEGWVSEL